MKVIDVSKHQGTINWAKVKVHIDGAIIWYGFGGSFNNKCRNNNIFINSQLFPCSPFMK